MKATSNKELLTTCQQVAVIRRFQALPGFIGRKGSAGGFLSPVFKASNLIGDQGRILEDLNYIGVTGISSVGVKSVDTRKNTKSEGG